MLHGLDDTGGRHRSRREERTCVLLEEEEEGGAFSPSIVSILCMIHDPKTCGAQNLRTPGPERLRVSARDGERSRVGHPRRHPFRGLALWEEETVQGRSTPTPTHGGMTYLRLESRKGINLPQAGRAVWTKSIGHSVGSSSMMIPPSQPQAPPLSTKRSTENCPKKAALKQRLWMVREVMAPVAQGCSWHPAGFWWHPTRDIRLSSTAAS